MGKRRKGLGPNQVDFEGRGRRMCLREGDASACWHGEGGGAVDQKKSRTEGETNEVRLAFT